MQCLVKWAPLEHLRRQVELIQTTDDPVVQEIAMASQLHEAVFRRNTLSIHRCEYGCEDDGFRKRQPLVWNDVEDKSNANKLVHIEACKGGTVADCEALVSTWASDPSVLDCWLPQTTRKGMPNAVLKWVPSKTEKPEFFMVRLITATMSRKFVTQDLKKLVLLFQEKGLDVSFLVVVLDKATFPLGIREDGSASTND